MKYRVIVQRLALEDLNGAFAWAAGNAPATAIRWLDRFHSVLRGLDTNPQRCPHAREQRKVDVELREILFGRRPNVYRVIFLIEADCVRVLRIRRAQRSPLTRQQIVDASKQDEPEES
jgi:plasmid stabilization system protein ParE